MLILITDYSLTDPYVGQMKVSLHALAPTIPIVDLMHEVPAFNAHAGAHLLAALGRQCPPGSVFICVIDPGVGGDREAVVVEADGKHYVGPDNGLLSLVAARARQARVWRVAWRPDELSSTFHGRDLFAPVAARLATASIEPSWLVESDLLVRFDDAALPRIIYMDHYGNAWTGIRGDLLDSTSRLEVAGRVLERRRTFSDAAKGEAFWYVNSVGLVEIAANRASAADLLGLQIGANVRLSGSVGSHLH